SAAREDFLEPGGLEPLAVRQVSRGADDPGFGFLAPGAHGSLIGLVAVGLP
ncbi:MAG: hypothetical protein HYZ72_19765, partial [Deltaproteobacteria bacterium]|nr:hypothetical protein [Deltaproteobacteria bacterium]